MNQTIMQLWFVLQPREKLGKYGNTCSTFGMEKRFGGNAQAAFAPAFGNQIPNEGMIEIAFVTLALALTKAMPTCWWHAM